MQTMEAYLCWNFVMDLLVCTASALASGKDRLSFCLAGASLGTLYAGAAYYFPPLRIWPCAAAAGACMACISVRPNSRQKALRAVCALYAAALFASGAQLLVGPGQTAPASALAAAAGLALDLWLVRSRRMRLQTWDVQLILRTGSGLAKFRALVDTGNRLHEPISGLPVMIVEQKALQNALPPGFDAARALRQLPQGWRIAAYGVLGSGGKMPCFRPERLLVRCGERWLLAPDIWIAVYPGRIPGQTQALAPTVLGAVRPAQGPNMRVSHKNQGA